MRTFVRGLAARFIPARGRQLLGTAIESARSRAYSLPVVGARFAAASFDRLQRAPRQLNIEVTSICNARCIMCPREKMTRPMEPMSRALYEKIIGEAAGLGIKRFALNGYGEIFSAKKDYRYFITHLLARIPDARVIINTNASLMTEEAAAFLIDAGVDTVHVDIDGATAETYEKIRVNLHYDLVVRNVRRLLELRKARGGGFPKVRVGIIRQPANEHEVGQFVAQWEGVADYVCRDFLVNRAGSVGLPTERNVRNACALPWFELNLYADGSAVLCCDDWNVEEPLGNARTQTIAEIWRGPRFREFRALQALGRAGEIGLCSKCNWARPGAGWFRKHVRRYAEARGTQG
ncbi:MAG: radical SAM protein [Oligoflexia bacterium]|nr:radical SAM protein [Oligoflexia bacterium]